MTGHVLIVDDDRDLCETLEKSLTRKGFHVSWKTSAEDALMEAGEGVHDVVLADLNMPHMNGLQLCERLAGLRPDLPVVLLTAFGSMETAVSAIRAGAYDFVTKPIETDALALTLERAVRHRSLLKTVNLLERKVQRMEAFDQIMGASPQMKKLFRLLEQAASSDASVLVTGESGTGKELVARSLHAGGKRASGPFVVVNCSAIPEALFESELFGHAKGAFTGARESRKGLFLQADGGTLFLDEIGDLPLMLQPKLLRALEARSVRAVGTDHEAPFDVRVIAATNRDLESAVEEGRFREDLFYRIDVVHIEVPPLRSRGNDVLLLARHFMDRFASEFKKSVSGFDRAVAEKIVAFSWPGNVRELRNCMESAVALTPNEEITVNDLPEKVRSYASPHIYVGGHDPKELLPMEEVESRYIQHVLRVVNDNKTLAAHILGFDRRTLHRKLKREKGRSDEL